MLPKISATVVSRAALLARRFVKDYEDCIQQYALSLQLELTEHLLTMLDLIEQYAQSNDDSCYQQYRVLEDTLLAKHRKILQPYINKQFYHYFSFDVVLVEKGIISTAMFNATTGTAQQRLSVQEVRTFVAICKGVLSSGRTYILLRMEPALTVAVDEAQELSLPVMDEPDNAITQSRQLLALYYLFKSVFDIEHRVSHPVSAIARFIHLMTGTRFSNLQKSEIYKKYQQMPNYKTDAKLKDDLLFIRPYFEELGFDSALSLIDQEMERCAGKGNHANKS